MMSYERINKLKKKKSSRCNSRQRSPKTRSVINRLCVVTPFLKNVERVLIRFPDGRRKWRKISVQLHIRVDHDIMIVVRTDFQFKYTEIGARSLKYNGDFSLLLYTISKRHIKIIYERLRNNIMVHHRKLGVYFTDLTSVNGGRDHYILL